MTVDLHLHTTASDGSLTPRELVDRAGELGYDAIAITDHDTVAGINLAVSRGKEKGVEVIPGIEINTDYGQREVHILGYYIDPDNSELRQETRKLKEMRVKRARKIVDNLREMEINISWEDVVKYTGGGTVGRGHIARALLEKGIISSWDEAFTRYLGTTCPAYEPRTRLKSGQAIKLVKRAGGIPVLAHPGITGSKEIVSEVIDQGIEGLEVYYYEHSYRQIKYYRKLAHSKNLLITGGSDCHGPENRGGLRLGRVRLSYKIVEQLQRKKSQYPG